MPYTKTTRQNCALVYVDITIPASNQKGILRVVNAGCITPIMRRVDGTVEWVDVGGMPLGIGLGAQSGYQEVTLDVSKGDLIILISDGVVEAKNSTNEMFGFERLEEAVKSGPQDDASTMLGYLQAKVIAFMDNAELHDDLTIVVAQV
jgi:sigma-B regulation protein RsbU (phosphoserine phosphatase)